MSALVDILMATYNGERFVADQLLSLLQQEYPHIHIYIRDDGSTDQTVNIIEDFCSKYPQNITFIQDGKKNLGATQNFAALMEYSTASYICFSDQDDIWMKDKVQWMMGIMEKTEKQHPGVPVYVFSDLTVADTNMNITHRSLNQRDGLSPRKTATNQLLMQNVPYGCATMINRELLLKSLPIPKDALLHDHWMALVASLFGKITYLDEPLVLHRIHDNNASRAGSVHRKEIDQQLASKINNKNFHNYLFKQVAQAEALLKKFEPELSEKQVNTLQQFIALKTTKGIERKKLIIKNRFFKNAWLNTIKLIVRA